MKKYLILNADYNKFGYVPRSDKFLNAAIKAFGKLRKWENDYTYIALESGGSELSRYDEKGKRWTVLCFPSVAAGAM